MSSKQRTEKDEVLQKAKAALKNKQWKTFLHGASNLNPVARAAMTQIWRVQNEPGADDSGLILRGLCIVVPTALWNRIIELAHPGHQGIAKTKARLCRKFGFLA